MSCMQLTAPTTRPFSSRSGSMLASTRMRLPSRRSTINSRSRIPVCVRSTCATGRSSMAIGLPSARHSRCAPPKRRPLSRSGAIPHSSTARWLYRNSTPSGPQMKVGSGKTSIIAHGSASRRVGSTTGFPPGFVLRAATMTVVSGCPPPPPSPAIHIRGMWQSEPKCGGVPAVAETTGFLPDSGSAMR